MNESSDHISDDFDHHHHHHHHDEFDEFEDFCYDDPEYCMSPTDETIPDHDHHHTIMMDARRTILICDITIITLAALSVFANIVVTFIYSMMGRMRKKIPNYVLFIQAFVDLIVATYAILSVLPNFMPNLHTKPYHIVTTVLGQWSVFLALGVLILTSIERFLALYKPLLHRRKVTKFKVVICTILVWVLSLCPSIVYIYVQLKELITPKLMKIWFCTRVSLVFTGILFVLTLLFFTYRAISGTLKRNITRSKETMRHNERRGSDYLLVEQRKQSKMMRIFISMATVYSLSYLPNATFEVLHRFSALTFIKDELSHYLTMTVAFILYIASALFDPILTLLLKDDFKSTARRLMKRHCGKLNSSSFGARRKNDMELHHFSSTTETSLLRRDDDNNDTLGRSRTETATVVFNTSTL